MQVVLCNYKLSISRKRTMKLVVISEGFNTIISSKKEEMKLYEFWTKFAVFKENAKQNDTRRVG